MQLNAVTIPDGVDAPAQADVEADMVDAQAMASRLQALNQWVLQVARLTQPDRIQWCDGSDSEFAALTARMEADGTLLPLNPDTHPRSWLHRSHPDDVARVEHLTFVCTI